MSDNLFLPETLPPPVAPKPEPVIEPSAKKNLSIPWATFGAIPFETCEEVLEAAGLKTYPYNLVLYRLFGFLDWNKTVRIGAHDFMNGWTCIFAEDTLAEKLGMCGKTARKALHSMVEAGLLQSEKVGKCFRYLISFFMPALQDLRLNPPDTIKVEYLKPKDKSDSGSTEIKHTNTDNHKPRNLVPKQKTEPRSMSESGSPMSEPRSDNQESLQDTKQETPVSDYSGPNEEDENRGDSLIEEKEDARAEKEKASLGKDNDVVPSKQIGEMLDSLTQSKGMDTSPTDDSVEAIITAFNPQSPAISNWKHAQVASVLKGHLEGVLRAASIDMPPILFFKHCLREMDNRLADGKIDTRPSSLNFFLTAATGKDIVVRALDNLKSERTAEKTVQKTDTYMQGERDRSATEREIPAAAKAKLDKWFGR